MRKLDVQRLILWLRNPDVAWQSGINQSALPLLEHLLTSPTSAVHSRVVCTAQLGPPTRDVKRIAEVSGYSLDGIEYERTSHRWAWPLVDVVRESSGIIKGKQGIWTWNEH